MSDMPGSYGAFNTTCCTCSKHYSINLTSGSETNIETSGVHTIYNIGIEDKDGKVLKGDALLKRIIKESNNGNPGGHYTRLAEDQSGTKLIVYDERSNQKPNKSAGQGIISPGTATMKKLVDNNDLTLQIGPSAPETLTLDLPNISKETCNIANVRVTSVDEANDAIQSFQDGINFVSGERARMGAYQNRLEHTLHNNAVTDENITASESRIRDTDMAKEMAAYTKNNVLQNASQSMLAQANQRPQEILQLLNS